MSTVLNNNNNNNFNEEIEDDEDEIDLDMLSDDSYDDDEDEYEDDQNELVLGVDDLAATKNVDDECDVASSNSSSSGNWHMLSIDVGCGSRMNDGGADGGGGEMMPREAATTLLSTSFASPPPKPARTFEHDIYVSSRCNKTNLIIVSKLENNFFV